MLRAMIFAAFMMPFAALAAERSETVKSVSAGAPFDITLPANPSTGYAWKIDEAASRGLKLLKVEDLGTTPPPSEGGRPRIGAPVLQTWLVTPRVKGTALLVFVWQRPWEKEPPAKTHVFKIEIGD